MNPSGPSHASFAVPLDQAIADPADDLLGVGIYASRLANYILTAEPNLTIGVYGQWGAGKTSFVQLVQRELGDRVRFISFVAWPYKTSDELWRALILTIARDLYGVAPGSILLESLEASASSFGERCRQFLHKNAVVLHDASQPAERLETFKELIDELDQIQLGSIRKTPVASLDENQALAVTVKTVAAAVSAVSPLGGAIRRFLGLGDDLKVSELLQGDNSKATLSRMQSIERFQKLLEDLFQKRAAGVRVCVFVDDLDRSMPDVALDLLEAIRIFLGKVNCTFIVAADQELIGQGLKARFRDVMESAQSEQDREFYARKGREYFEKIIQFGVPVPEPAPEQGYRFVTAGFPGWAPAADLITAAIGANPRRLRQYCTLLDYRWRVGNPSGALSDELRDKSIALYWRAPALAAGLLRVAQRPSSREDLRALEALLADSAPNIPHPDARQRLPDHHLMTLYLEAVRLTPVMNLLLRPPLLSQQEPGALTIVLGLSDLHPDTADVLKTEDPPFARALERLIQGIPIRPETLLYEDLTRLLELKRDAPTIVHHLIEIAKTSDYAEQMKSVDRSLRNPTRGLQNRSEGARRLIDFATDDQVEMTELDRRRDLLLKKPYLFTIQPVLIQDFAAAHDQLPDPRVLLPPEVYGEHPSPADQIAALANHLLKRLPHRQELDHVLVARIEIATRFLERRRFAKVDGLQRSWPELATYLYYDRPKLLAIEESALDADKPLAEPLAKYLRDERLIRFLRLRPYLRDLYPGEVTRIAVAAATAVTAAPAAVPGRAPPVAAPSKPERLEAPRPSEPKRPDPSIPQPVPELAFEGADQYEIWYLAIEADASGMTGAFQARLLDSANRTAGEFRLNAPQPFRDKYTDRAELRSVLVKQGAELFEQLPMLLQDRIARPGNRVRLLIQFPTTGPDIAVAQASAMAWEAIYVPAISAFPAVSGHLSVVRYLSSNVLTRPEFGHALRVLAIIPGPEDMPAGSVAEEREILDSAFELPGEVGLVQYQVLSGRASLPDVLQAVRQFRPQVFHYFGHSYVDRSLRLGGVLLTDEAGMVQKTPASLLQGVLGKSSVALAVLLGNETGSGEFGAQNSVAGRLVATGTLAAIGALSNISVQSALLFSRAFYMSLLESGNVETALAAARQALDFEGEDWSAYALFSSANRLEDIKLTRSRVA
jgi:KAP family P-loop domain/CHAT domain